MNIVPITARVVSSNLTEGIFVLEGTFSSVKNDERKSEIVSLDSKIRRKIDQE